MYTLDNIDSTIFNGEVSSDLLCPICQEILKSVYEVPCCHQLFCFECIQKCLISDSYCPLCRTKISLRDCKPNHPVQRIVDSLPVSCPKGCNGVVTIGTLSDHQKLCKGVSDSPLNEQKKRVFPSNETNSNSKNYWSKKPKFSEQSRLFNPNEHLQNLSEGKYGISLSNSREKKKTNLNLVLINASRGNNQSDNTQDNESNNSNDEISSNRAKYTSLPEVPVSQIESLFPKYREFAHLHLKELVHIKTIQSREAVQTNLPSDLPPEIISALTNQGFKSLFSHQIETRNAIKRGKDVIITTPTSSGKSMSFNIPTFEVILRNPQATTALYLFPLNALAKDQEEKLNKFNESLPIDKRLKIITLIGDVSMQDRRDLFADGYPHILICNPDLLHYQLNRGRQSGWKNWTEFLKRLRIVILDEAHSYSGIVGCHVTNVIRRLYNVIDNLKSNSARIQFILASATIGNSVEMALKLTSRENSPYRIHWVSENGASQPARSILCFAAQPYPQKAAATIIAEWIEMGLTGIVFCNSINAVNTLHSYLAESQKYKDYSTYIRSYYASMPKHVKAGILDQLKKGELKIIIATNALEAGIDLPCLDCVLLRGYPGSRMSFLQRMGRAGRKYPGLVAFLPSRSNTLDFYFAEHPDVLLGSDIEKVAFNPNYPTVLGKHLLCAAVESGLPNNKIFGVKGDTLLKAMESKGLTELKDSVWIGNGYPHRDFNLRGGYFADIEAKFNDRVIERVSLGQALTRLFPGAVFMSQDAQGQLYRYDVVSLDMELKKATLVTSKYPPNVIVKPISSAKVWGEKYFKLGDIEAAEIHITYAWANITSSVIGYEVIKHSTSKQGSERKETKETKMYEKPFSLSYEAPCLKLAYSTNARNAMNSLVENHLKELAHDIKGILELQERHRELSSSEGAFISIHTLLHQLISVVPLVLLSSNDIDEADLSVDRCEGFLVDSESFQEYVKKAIDFSKCCGSCKGSWGCATCLFRSNCEERNECLLTCAGFGAFPLKEISQATSVNADENAIPITNYPLQVKQENQIKVERVPLAPQDLNVQQDNFESKILDKEREILEKEKKIKELEQIYFLKQKRYQ